MKRFILLLLTQVLILPCVVFGATSAKGSINIVKNKVPANLSIKKIEFIDKTGNKAIDANEECKIMVDIENSGAGNGRECELKTIATGNLKGVSFNKSIPFSIAANSKGMFEIPITSDMTTEDGEIAFTIVAEESNGFGSDPSEISVQTKAFEAPFVKLTDYKISGTSSSQIKKKQPFDLQLLVQNVKHGMAENVEITVTTPDNVIVTERPSEKIGELKGGKVYDGLVYSLIVNNNYTDTKIPINVKINERYGKYAKDTTLVLSINQNFTGSKIVVSEIKEERQRIDIASLSSQVDRAIPQTTDMNDKTFAVVIANENYKHVDGVPFAINDGNIFKEYLEKTLGIPQSNIHVAFDASLGDIKQHINWLKSVIEAYNGEAKIVFYYAGHGIPDESTKAAYLLPVDGTGSDLTTAYKLDDIYDLLGSFPSESVTIFLDACFSGSKRENGMLASARGVAIKAKGGKLKGNMVVFSAATDDQTAYPYEKEKHGLFTYYLLEKLQTSGGDCTLGELGNYIKDNVNRTSIVKNGKTQTPTISASESANGWQTWKLK